ncbi:ATP-dependent nuclease [Prevotella melaninogenica]|uniref:ATP-dependent nuclease n=1 Tax=Prevotella melaninogenica TaxID=28132 RepID=UPI001BA8B3F1|nr:AAA family ATPase [Prevotella melaninogenica]QUB66992.1 ATP-binding protein [Prevotella melaninogenica]
MARIHQLKICHFRGIEQFEQYFGDTNLIVLIGRGDSGKSTILKAISLALSPTWNNTFTDTDFYNLDTTIPIEIEVSLRCVPDKLLTDAKYGFYKRLLVNGEIIDDISKSGEEPFAEEEDILTIKLVVDDTLQPKWYVVNEREQDDIEISHRDRALLDMFMIADYADNHFSYNKLSPLYALLKKGLDAPDTIEKKLVDVVRQAYQSIASNMSFQEFEKVVLEIKQQALHLGIEFEDLKTSLEYKGNAYTESNITLHDGQNRPLGMYGKGSKRLLSIAIQLALAKAGGIILIDEIEQGLEPDRIRTIIKKLSQVEQGQIFVTTHSRDVVVESKANSIYLMKKDSNFFHQFEPELQGLLRSQPEAFFARRVILCEGATEYGIIRALDQHLQGKDKLGLSARSIAIVDSKGGDNFYQYAIWLKHKGFDVITFNDDDNTAILSTKKEATNAGVLMAICDAGNAFEQQLFNDVPWNIVIALAQLAKNILSEEAVVSCLDGIQSISDLNSTIVERQFEIRQKLGTQSKKKGWYKNVTDGENLGELLFLHMDTIEDGKTLRKELYTLIDWINE